MGWISILSPVDNKPKGESMIRCSKCGAKNRIPLEKMNAVAKCGKCGAVLAVEPSGATRGESILFRCPACRTRNKIPSGKLEAGAKCGKCGEKLNTEQLFVPQPMMVSEGNFDSQVLNSPLPVLVFAWAPWCPTCKTALPVIDDFAKDAKKRIRVGKLNVDSSPSLASKYNILSVPQLLIFDNGRLQETMPGTIQKHELMVKMAGYL